MTSQVWVSLEPVAWAMRIHPGPSKLTYVGSASVTVDDMRTATLRAMSMKEGNPFTPAVFRAVEVAMAGIDVKEMVWSRRKEGEEMRRLRRRIAH